MSLFESAVSALATVMVIFLFAFNPHFHPYLHCRWLRVFKPHFPSFLKVVSDQFVLMGDPGEICEAERKGEVNVLWFDFCMCLH